MNITINDVASKAGVSPSTVSLVLNNRPGIGEKTRKRVLQAAVDLDYKLPAATKQNKSGKMISFLKIAQHGHILNRNHNIFISDYIEGIDISAREYGLGLEVKNYSHFDFEQILMEVNRTDPIGVIVLATELYEEDIPLFKKIDKPVVFIDASHTFYPFDFVDMDNEGAVFSIISELKEKGHKKIGIVKAAIETRNFRLRGNYFVEALDYFNLESNTEWNYTIDSTFENALDDMSNLLKEKKDLPTAFFCVCDIIAYGCLRALQNQGFRIPEDISVVGFDDLPSSLLTNPPLASIKVSKRRIGRRAFQLLARHLETESYIPFEKVFVGSELIVRQSIGPVS